LQTLLMSHISGRNSSNSFSSFPAAPMILLLLLSAQATADMIMTKHAATALATKCHWL
jgi:hypothetical protein